MNVGHTTSEIIPFFFSWGFHIQPLLEHAEPGLGDDVVVDDDDDDDL